MKSKKIMVLIVSLVIIFLIVALLYIILYNNNRMMSNNTPIESSKFNSQTDNQVHNADKNMTIVDISQSNNSTNTVVNLNDKRNLTDEELEGIRQMLTTYGVFSNSSWNGYPSFHADSLYLMVVKENFDLKRLVLDEIPYTYDQIVDIYCKYHNLTTLPMAGSGKLDYCTLNDIQRMYRLVFDVDITKETLIANIKKEGACYDEKEQLLIISTGFWGESSFDIVSSYYSNNNYYLELSENNINIGTVVFKKVDDRYCYVSYEANNAEKLDINSELVQELYGYIPNASDICRWDEITDTIIYPLDAYRSKKVTIADIDNQVILKGAFYNKEIEVGVNAFVTEGTEEDLRKSHVGESAWYKFKEEVLEEAVFKMYGPNVNLKHEDFQVAQVASCAYISEEKMYHYSWGGGVGDYWSNITKIINAVKENNDIYLYVKNAYMHEIDEEEILDDNAYSDTGRIIFKIYDSSERNTILKEVIINESEFDYYSENARYEIVKDYLKNYKHTFKQAEDGSYYWYSTEPIE